MPNVSDIAGFLLQVHPNISKPADPGEQIILKPKAFIELLKFIEVCKKHSLHDDLGQTEQNNVQKMHRGQLCPSKDRRHLVSSMNLSDDEQTAHPVVCCSILSAGLQANNTSSMQCIFLHCTITIQCREPLSMPQCLTLVCHSFRGGNGLRDICIPVLHFYQLGP